MIVRFLLVGTLATVGAMVWRHMARSVLGEMTTSVALEAIDAAVARLQGLGSAHENIRPAFAAVAEGTWWVAAVNERMTKGLGEYASGYRAARDASLEGALVAGFLWVRDRHTHQLPFTTGYDARSFYASPGESAVLQISRGFTWLPTDDVYGPSGSRSRAEWREAYDHHLAGRSTWKTLALCSRWFHHLAGHEQRV